MFKIEVNDTSAKIYLDKEFKLHFGHSGDSPLEAVRNLLFYMENEFNRLEMVGESDLTEEAQERMRLLKQFIRKPE